MTQSEKRLFLIQSLLKERPEYRQVETPRDPEGQRQLLRGLMNVPPQAADRTPAGAGRVSAGGAV